MNFIKTLFFHFKKKYGYLAQRFTKKKMQALSKNISDKQSNKVVLKLLRDLQNQGLNKEGEREIQEARKYIFPSYEAFEKATKAFIEEEKERERHTNKYPKRTIKRKTDGKVRTLRKQKGD